MNEQLEGLVRKYYGHVADLEGSGVESFDLLFVRDQIQAILNRSTPDQEVSDKLYEQVYQLDLLLWAEKVTFLKVVGVPELRHARQQQQSPRSHWWWYLDSLATEPSVIQERQRSVSDSLVPV